MDKLAEIMAHKRREVAPLMRSVTEAELVRAAAARPKPPPFAVALRRARPSDRPAAFKRPGPMRCPC
jgi:indole-3-glycerol phosphate synthase